MRKYLKPSLVFLVIWICILYSVKLYAQQEILLKQTIQCTNPEWKLVFNDEFDGNILNTHNWVTWFPYTDDGSDKCSFCRTHGNEGQIFRDENAVVNEGSLKLIAKRESGEWMGEKRDFSSAMIHSRQQFGMGKYEVRCRIPSGMGFWTAFWMFGQKATEIDVFEIGSQNPRHHHVAIHSWSTKTDLEKGYKGPIDFSDGFHIYTMIWDADFLSISVDGNEVWRVSKYLNKRGRVIKRCPVKAGTYRLNPTFPPDDEKLSVIAGMAVGTSNTPFTKSPDENTVFPNQMEIDWIRIYKKVE